MNILVLNYEFIPLGGGASPVSYELSRGFVELGHHVDVVTMRYKGLSRFEIIDGVNVYRVRCVRRKRETCETYEMVSYILSAMHFLRNLIKSRNYNICHCHFIIPTGILAYWVKRRFGINYVLTCHGSDVPKFNPDRFYFQHRFTRPLLKKICKNAIKICSPSIYLSNLIKKNIGNVEINHIPNGINLETFRLNYTRPKENIILSSGRLLKRKGFHTLIKAVRDVELPFEVHIAGDGPYRQHLEKMAIGSKTKIIFHGWLEKESRQLIELYEKAKIYVLVSSRENASIALLEGMAAGTAVISTNVSGCPETVGDAGFLIDYDDHKRLQDILVELGQKPEILTQFGEKVRKRIQTNFLWKGIIDEYVSILEQVCKSG